MFLRRADTVPGIHVGPLVRSNAVLRDRGAQLGNGQIVPATARPPHCRISNVHEQLSQRPLKNRVLQDGWTQSFPVRRACSASAGCSARRIATGKQHVGSSRWRGSGTPEPNSGVCTAAAQLPSLTCLAAISQGDRGGANALRADRLIKTRYGKTSAARTILQFIASPGLIASRSA